MIDTGLRLTVSAVTVDAPEPASCSVRDESYGIAPPVSAVDAPEPAFCSVRDERYGIAPHRLCCHGGRAGAGLLLGAVPRAAPAPAGPAALDVTASAPGHGPGRHNQRTFAQNVRWLRRPFPWPGAEAARL